MIEVKVNGTEYSHQEGKTILDLLHTIGIDLPTLCYDKRLIPAFSCRMCLVKVKGISRIGLLPACNTKLSENMEIETHLPEIEDYRKSILRMLASNYPLSAVCKDPNKEFHGWLHHYGIVQEMHNDVSVTVDASHPYIQVDMSRCISCFRCVNICNAVQGQFVWHVVDKGDNSKIIPDSKGLLADSPCVSCGACADTCPTGAIEDKHMLHDGIAERKINTVCAYCGVGCEIEVGVKNNVIAGIHPKLNSPVNKGHLCVKGRYAWGYGNSEDRIKHPMIRTDGEWKIVSWTEAIRYCSQKLKSTALLHGPDSIAVLGSARATNEENYLIQKFTRTVLGTNNIDCCARVCHQPTAKAMGMILGTGAATNSFDDIEKAKTILVVGSNTTENHPVVGARIKQMALRGANLIVIDPRKIELADVASCHLSLKPGTNVPLLNAMAQVIVEEELFNREFIQNRIEGWDEYKRSIYQWAPERVAKSVECTLNSSVRPRACMLVKPLLSAFTGLVSQSMSRELKV